MTTEAPHNLKELFSYRLNRLANVSSRLAALSLEQRYDLEPRDWRIIALLAQDAPMSIKTLARELHLDKSQASRDITSLLARDLVARATDLQDGRGVQIRLSADGQDLYRRVFPEAVERNERLLSVLNKKERQVLEQAMQKLTGQALRLLEEHKDPAAASRARGLVKEMGD